MSNLSISGCISKLPRQTSVQMEATAAILVVHAIISDWETSTALADLALLEALNVEVKTLAKHRLRSNQE